MIYRNNDLEQASKFISNPGNQFENLYSAKVQKDGSVLLEVTGQKDIRQEIDSWREHTDMSWILRQMANGTYQPKVEGMYGDFTEMPETMAEAMQVMIDAESAFYKLDLETRNKFDNDYKKWLVMANQDVENFGKLMGFVNEVKEEVKEDVQEQ